MPEQDIQELQKNIMEQVEAMGEENLRKILNFLAAMKDQVKSDFETLHTTSKFEIVEQTHQGRRYCFFCELTGTAVYTTEPVCAETSESELELAWQEAGLYFNGCSECGKWIRDEAYNIDEMKCIACAPYKSKPRYCTKCGCPIPSKNRFCVRCGTEATEVVFAFTHSEETENKGEERKG